MTWCRCERCDIRSHDWESVALGWSQVGWSISLGVLSWQPIWIGARP